MLFVPSKGGRESVSSLAGLRAEHLRQGLVHEQQGIDSGEPLLGDLPSREHMLIFISDSNRHSLRTPTSARVTRSNRCSAHFKLLPYDRNSIADNPILQWN